MCFEYKNKFHTDNDFKVALLKGDFKSMLDNGTLKFDNAKTLFNAIPERSAETLSMATTPGSSEEMGARIPESGQATNAQVEQPKGETTGEEPEMTGITHAQMDETAKEFGLETYEKDPEKVSEWDKQANERIAKDPNAIPNLLNRMRDGEMPDHVEQRMMVKYISDLKAKLNENPTSDELLSQLKRAKDLSNIVGGRAVAKSLVARKGEVTVEKTLPDYLLREMESSGVGKLTAQQKEQATKEYENISKAENDYKQKIQQLEEENTRLKAQKELNRQKSTSKTNRTSEDFKKEREGLKEQLKKAKEDYLAKLKEQGIRQAGVGGPIITNETAKIIGKIVKSYVDEGVTKLEEVTKKVFEDVKDFIDGISEKDIHNIIAGQYNKPQITKNELAIKLRDLKIQAQLVNRLEQLEKGEEPKTEKLKVKKNQEIEDLKNKIKDYKKAESEANKFYTEEPFKEGEKRTPLEQLKVRTQNQINKVQKDLDTGNFLKEQEEKPKLKLDKEAIESRDKLMKLKQEREIRLIKQQYANRSNKEKLFDYTAEVLNVPRTIMSSTDFSAPLRQGIIPTISHPLMAGKAFGESVKMAFSQKAFDRWFFDLKESPRYKVMMESNLSISDPHDYRLTAKEEAFMNNLAEKIPFIGPIIKGSERAYVGFLNKMRVDLFNRGANLLESEGKTFENAQQEYEALGKWTNISTGRGELSGKLKEAAPLLNTAFFAPRLIAARLEALNPMTYVKLPPTIRKQALADMFKFIGFGTTVLGVAKLNGAQVETDPRSSDFGRIKVGDTRYDIWGGFQPYVRFFAQMISGQTKSTNTGKIQELGNKKTPFGRTRWDVIETFGRGKLSPVPGMAVDWAHNWRDLYGQKETLPTELEKNFLPMISNDIISAWNDQGVKSLFTVGIPSSLGVGVNTYQPKQKK